MKNVFPPVVGIFLNMSCFLYRQMVVYAQTKQYWSNVAATQVAAAHVNN